MSVLRGPFDFIISHIVNSVVFWLAGIPVAVMFAAYLVGIAVMCTKEVWRTRERTRNGGRQDEKTDPYL